eukprot:TRINITY_DN6824_c0_g1_i1.p1 TRINITY_DN6824_c0_g1~~TRINITY_DN6824_c0_g1_i1.p1  ORF type:complete len:1026 (+),score=195.67 TRINITY_DN6824_c0_g1_i1:129-3206(+)
MRVLSGFLFLVFLVAFVRTSKPDHALVDESKTSCVWLSAVPPVRLWWSVNVSHVEWVLDSPIDRGEGWIGLGLSTDGSMTSGGGGTDMYVAYIAQNGTLFVHDYWAIQHSIPLLDAQQNIAIVGTAETIDVELSVNHSRSLSRFGMTRLLDTGDEDQDRIMSPKDPLYVLWAYSEVAPVSPTKFSRHQSKGVATVDWTTVQECPSSPDSIDDSGEDGEKVTANGRLWSNNDESYNLKWGVDEEEEAIVFQMSVKTTGWVAVGFSSSANMFDADTVVGWVGDPTKAVKSTVLVDGYIGSKRGPPTPDIALGGTNDVTLITASADSKWTNITFKRPLVTDDRYDEDFLGGAAAASDTIYVLWAYGKEDGSMDGKKAIDMAMHERMGVARLTLLTEEEEEEAAAAADVEIERHQPRSAARRAHGAMMIVGWACFAPVGVHAARFLKAHTAWWWPLHWITQALNLVATLAGAGIIFWEVGRLNFASAHERIGILVVFLSVVTSVLGIVAHFRYDPSRESPPIFPDRIHWWCARLLMILALVNIGLGVVRYQIENVTTWMIGATAVSLFLASAFLLPIMAAMWSGVEALWGRVKGRVAGAGTVIELGSLRPPKQRYEHLEDDDEDDEVATDGHIAVVASDDSSSPSSSDAGSDDGIDVQGRGFKPVAPTKSEVATSRRDLFLIVVLIVATAALGVWLAFAVFSEADDVETVPFSFCPDCIEANWRYDKFAVPVGLHSTPHNDITLGTAYLCKGFEFDPDRTMHIVEIEAIVDQVDVVHHMILYAIPYQAEGVSPCLSMPNSAYPLYAWAVGGEKLTIPREAGILVGKGTDVRYAVLQIHYDNGAEDPNIIDSSGVTMKMTTTLRPLDAGVLFVGSDLKSIVLPPGQAEIELSGNCGPRWTNSMPFPISVFGSGVHAHRLGRHVWTEQWRDGELVDLIGLDMAYDFNDQKVIPVTKTIRPGDDLVTHCVYDTTSAKSVTLGGEATNNEMCLNYFFYYPKLDAPFCLSKAKYWNATTEHFRPSPSDRMRNVP